MMEQIEQDLKQALLGGDRQTVETLRGLKGALLNEAIFQKARGTGLPDDQIQKVLAKESKKRLEAAQLYKQGGAPDKADKELSEKAIIDKYLPEQMSEEQVAKIVDEEITKAGSPTMQAMGKIIGAVRGRTQGQADGGLIAKLVKEKLN